MDVLAALSVPIPLATFTAIPTVDINTLANTFFLG
jgi:hypothetical protein